MAMERWRPVDRFDPFRNVGEIQHEVNRIFDSFFGRPPAQGVRGDRVWAPLVDMYETKDDLVLMTEVPGVKEKDVSVSITGDLVSIKGERRFDEASLMAIIDGRRVVPVHGPREMPVWGAVFSAGHEDAPYQEYTTLLHTESLVDYLRSIQEEVTAGTPPS